MEKLVASVYPTQEDVLLRVGSALSLRMGSFPLLPTEVILGQVHDRTPQIRGECFWSSEVVEAPEGPHERVLRKVLGHVPVPGQEISEPNGVGAMPMKEVRGPSLTQGQGRPGRSDVGHRPEFAWTLLTIHRRPRGLRDRARSVASWRNSEAVHDWSTLTGSCLKTRFS
jgi:hypothetical protein